MLKLNQLRDAVAGTAAALRCVTEYQPAGGPGDKVFPPTYEGGKYATEARRLWNKKEEELEDVPCVLLDSVQSQANRMELALLDAWERKRIPLPVITVDFAGNDLPKVMRITSLEAPHRIADAILRDSLLGKVRFRESEVGKQLDHVDNRNATPLFQYCPTSLVFGMWDSTGPRGGLGAKFARAMVSEIVGVHAQTGVKTSSRIDPTQVSVSAGPLYARDDDPNDWTLDEDEAAKEKRQPVLYNRNKSAKGTPGNPSKANLGNVTPTIADGGVTIGKATQTTVLSLPALRRLRFPVNGKLDPKVDDAARTALAALALSAAALVRESGCDLRSRCQLHATSPIVWDLLDKPGDKPETFSLKADEAIEIYKETVLEAKHAGLPWLEQELILKPSPQLVALVKKSQELAAKIEGGEE